MNIFQAFLSPLKKSYGSEFMNMKSCIIEQHEADLIFLPSHHEELEMWVGHTVEHENNIKISVNSPAAEIGATLRLTFSCCTG